MKILILSTKLPYPPRDGGAIATLNLATGLAKTGMEVTMLSFNTSKHYFPPEKIPGELQNLIRFETIDQNTAIKPLRAILNLLFSQKPYIAVRFQSKNFSTALARLLTTEKYDFIQLEGPYLSTCLPLIKRYSTALTAYRAHNVEHEIWERRWKNEPWMPAKWYFRILAERIRNLEMNLLEQIDLLIPISERDSRILLAERPHVRSITIPAGIDMSAYPPPAGQHHSDKEICFIGALDWAPNQEGLIWFIYKVLPHLLEHAPDFRLHVAGRNAPERFIHKLAHPSIVYHGEVEDAGEFMNRFRVMAAPLLSGSGIRVKILEGMARGMCIVTTTIGAEGIPAENGKHLLIADDGRAFAQAVIQLLEDKTMARSLAKEARNFILEKFDTLTIASALGNLYKKMS
jgi:polysaccharide biosynthesis protein PslH